MKDPLHALRVRLTIWYVGVFAIILFAFSATLFFSIGRQISREMDESLAKDAAEVARVYDLPEDYDRLVGPHPRLNLSIPDRQLFVFDANGQPVVPDTAPTWLGDVARTAAVRDTARAETEDERGATWRAYATRFQSSGHGSLVAVAVANVVILDDRYAEFLIAFALAALAALAAVAIGGWLLALRSVTPVQESFGRMRRFMADAAHELRTPIAVLQSRADVTLRRDRDPNVYEAALTSISADARRLGGIVDNLLTIARADSGEWPLKRENVEIADLALDAVSAAATLGADKGVRVAIESAEEANVVGDSTLLRQLLLILLDNAVKFTQPGGEVTLAVTRESGKVLLRVSDNGPGIPPHVLPHVFDRFFRADQARIHGSGAGLGLSIAQWIVAAHGGEIRVDSTPGQGTRVSVTLNSA